MKKIYIVISTDYDRWILGVYSSEVIADESIVEYKTSSGDTSCKFNILEFNLDE